MCLLVVLFISLKYREKLKVTLVIPGPELLSQYTFNYDKMFTRYQQLLNPENYVTLRQSLKLLSRLFLDRHSFTVCIYL